MTVKPKSIVVPLGESFKLPGILLWQRPVFERPITPADPHPPIKGVEYVYSESTDDVELAVRDEYKQ